MFVVLYISTSGQFLGPANSIGHIVGVEILISFLPGFGIAQDININP
jgi:hypothetical protein